jgi:hypothetical protein
MSFRSQLSNAEQMQRKRGKKKRQTRSKEVETVQS